MDTLAVRLTVPLIGPAKVFHLLGLRRAGRTKKKSPATGLWMGFPEKDFVEWPLPLTSATIYLAVRLARRFAHMAKPTRPIPTKSIIEGSGSRRLEL